LVGHGGTVGVFHLLWDTPADAGLGEGIQLLAATVGAQVAMATANLRLRDTLRELSIKDPLTALFNRRFMEETLSRQMARATRGGYPLAVLQLDIDHFKRFNDGHGHEAGDAVMKAVSEVMLAMFRGGDVPCRYGGEEFTVILPDCPLHDAETRAEELAEKVRQLSVTFQGATLPSVTISCGVAAYPEHGESAQTIVSVADAALYVAKKSGRDRVSRARVDADDQALGA